MRSVPFDSAGDSATEVGENGARRRQRSDAALNRAKIMDAARRLLDAGVEPEVFMIVEEATEDDVV